MTEIHDLANLSISDSPQREEMKDDRDAALSTSGTLAKESHNATVRHIDQLDQLVDEVDPPIANLLKEGNGLREPPKMLGEVGVHLPIPPEHLDLRIKSFGQGFDGQLPAHERIDGVGDLSERVRALRHRAYPSRPRSARARSRFQ
jgi:hypothetical protein